MNCEMCGKDTELFNAVIEGTQLKVCAGCGKYGKILRKISLPSPKQVIVKREEPVQVEQIVSDYAQKIKSAREKRGMTQLEFSKLIAVKESLIHKMETGHFEPPIDMACKMEKTLHITLVEVREEAAIAKQKKEELTEGMTIGDLIKLKQKN